ncbi:hypothetical protein ebA2083 [Aromatoleum aromaticum EbN1]|uniref:Uncharacterized protein n=1 Tax=Aromatoleum aromaticum (strain DSM 19018 / LMG 30748 / EbN1) TaxID=76114 RepID=Q5P5Y6_AROAE|nr:hypothetical protein ebA2083 [Aromatoleum aromaticum EbN1]
MKTCHWKQAGFDTPLADRFGGIVLMSAAGCFPFFRPWARECRQHLKNLPGIAFLSVRHRSRSTSYASELQRPDFSGFVVIDSGKM